MVAMPFDIAAYAKLGADLRLRFLAENESKLRQAATWIRESLAAGGKVLAFGNGGSAADAQHLAAELIGRFKREREAFAAVALTTDTSILTALANDYGYDRVFARQIEGLGRAGDIAWAISTSGNSPNVLAAIATAKGRGLKVIGLCGGDGGKMAPLCDLALIVPSTDTALIQEAHVTILHVVCALVEG
jgi:D-sedoheptulose 7-phosphate isomerase